FSIVGTLYPIN
nr:Chain C, Gamma-aminobutyric acid receptor subunit alpha-3 [Rattus norvegicus]4TK3_D Chain D, Gamma-aminobutyric acid receptor subunit alpha-3 [Rattus norvegicus]4TK4_C Chain C, Gamma-aminobutyric acid receptor subunit alpha-3 [Rattus norvegicus]4TK4_D Chain D, Gamma-aminobutyric acid receptor subunit alpha-3 [Rattus norvegicus]